MSCLFSCDQPASVNLTWLTSRGREGGDMCDEHARDCWAKLPHAFAETVVIVKLEEAA